ncbi:MAG: cupin domain-containing protein [Burkholderiaceae bacterium]
MNFFKIAPLIMASTLCAHMAVSVAAEPYNAVLPKDIKWQDAPSIGPGAKSAVIDGDPKSAAPFVMRLKLPPNTTIKAHTHPTSENVTVISGMLYFAASDKVDPKIAKAFGPGSYFSIAQGKPMFAFSKDKEVVVQIHGIGPWGISYLESKDAPAMKP